MQSYEFIFECKRCGKELMDHVTSPEALTREELNQLEFQLACPNAGCGWSGTQSGAEAEKIVAALKPTPVCG